MTEHSITPADIHDPRIAEIVDMHRRLAQADADPAACHALDMNGFAPDNITLWNIIAEGSIVAIGALKLLDAQDGEIKSMFSLPEYRGHGYGAKTLEHLITQARKHGLQNLYLETGSWAYFLPARKLYEKFGFFACAPFADYKAHPESQYMQKIL